ncbi:Eukaryotic translation initiation factor 2D [Willisornis vidua]|uniref:Eukaryotic translation initiation factor 2D n=1 Tax=Willisornis vidua TaxID=1566151 RepID=A0ABQ9D3P0_9PASS|nr:Eukaryotic translation initiation factor 2D [Willisornis vidua]
MGAEGWRGKTRRKLRNDVAAAFPNLSAEQLSEFIPNKEELNVIKIYSHKGEAITVYMNHRNPILFEVEKALYPTVEFSLKDGKKQQLEMFLMMDFKIWFCFGTVYTLWVYPDLLPAFSTWPPVLQKLAGGAGPSEPTYPVDNKGVDIGTCSSVTVRAPVAVAVATMSTAEMLAGGMKGKGFAVLHTYLDHLWEYGDKSCPPTLAPLVPDCAGDEEEQEGKGPVSSSPPAPAQHVDMGDLSLKEQDSCAELGKEELPESRTAEPAENASTEEQQDPEESRTPQEQMDALFSQCFFHALKCKVKKADLPLLTSTFLRSHMFPCCPAGQQLDIKKSSYKKFSKFLQCMQNQKILKVKELSKGVESIVEVDWKHPDIKAFAVPEGFSSASAAQDSKNEDGEQVYHAPEITPLYGVPAKMIPLFQEAGHGKGSVLSSNEVRDIIINYVKTNELVDETNKNFVKVNAILCDCLLDKSEQDEISHLKWDDLLSRCLDRLQSFYRVTCFGQEPVVRKGTIHPICVNIEKRSANKKVTIIKNLELYGLDPQCVANMLQQKVQASATITPVPGAKDRVQVQIQGNQIHHLAKMLLGKWILELGWGWLQQEGGFPSGAVSVDPKWALGCVAEEFHLPRKHIRGLENAPKLRQKK